MAAGDFHTVGLRDNGTVVAVGYNNERQCNVEGWTDIQQVAAGSYHTVGLRVNGTVFATGWNTYGQCDVNTWTDIQQVAAGAFHTVGLKMDGRVVAAGYNEQSQCNTFDWNLGGLRGADIDGNGKIGLLDVILTLQVICGQMTELKVYKSVDINGDYRLGIEEATYILQEMLKTNN